MVRAPDCLDLGRSIVLATAIGFFYGQPSSRDSLNQENINQVKDVIRVSLESSPGRLNRPGCSVLFIRVNTPVTSPSLLDQDARTVFQSVSSVVSFPNSGPFPYHTLRDNDIYQSALVAKTFAMRSPKGLNASRCSSFLHVGFALHISTIRRLEKSGGKYLIRNAQLHQESTGQGLNGDNAVHGFKSPSLRQMTTHHTLNVDCGGLGFTKLHLGQVSSDHALNGHGCQRASQQVGFGSPPSHVRLNFNQGPHAIHRFLLCQKATAHGLNGHSRFGQETSSRSLNRIQWFRIRGRCAGVGCGWFRNGDHTFTLAGNNIHFTAIAKGGKSHAHHLIRHGNIT
mmetsp:Transcript_35654/g.74184  ORF Transcript_35654/g.74184 Transcript_35654/m.74184 type:complete len:340 (+) Transcript_35654:785-1804(+)